MSSDWITVYKSDLAIFRKDPKRVGKSEVIIRPGYIATDTRLLRFFKDKRNVSVWFNSCGELIIKEYTENRARALGRLAEG